jgi:uncharacterized protein YjbJ (UPF0337 family)
MNESSIAGKFDEMKGKAKQSVGETIGDERLANSGAADQVMGAAKESWGSVKDAASSVGSDAKTNSEAQAKDQAAANAHDFREKITHAAESAKDAITGKMHEVKHNN